MPTTPTNQRPPQRGNSARKPSQRTRQNNAQAQQRKRKRKVSPQMQRVYRRRRIVALVCIPLVIALMVFCIYSLIRGAIGMHEYSNRAEIMSISRSQNAPKPIEHSKVANCTLNDVDLDLVPQADSIPLGEPVYFTATIKYVGHNSAGCYVNGADDSRVLTITSGKDVVWRSDACEADPRPLLLYEGTSDEQEMIWDGTENGGQAGKGCSAEDQLPRLDRGTYVAQVSLKDHPKVQSKPVTITIT